MSTHFPPPRVAAIHDLSCLGRCALTVILPTLSVMGYQVIPLPTALLSTHTGGFTDLHFHDLTPDMEEIAAHFSRLGTSFRAIYSGFLGSVEQIEVVSRFVDRFGDRPDESGASPLVLIDPVMGDEGELYSTYTPDLMRGMRVLAHKADLLTPNLTEACFLTDTPYRDTAALSREEAELYVQGLMDRLEDFGAPRTVITGIHLSDGSLANLGRETDGCRFWVSRPRQERSYPGTGDIFASVLLGELLRTGEFRGACEAAAEFVAHVIQASAQVERPVREGVSLESHLHLLCHS
ncbi:MAG: pyridoxamine kinase [Clostridia bacterium]|nr:pyridoxamine kinase [Clostridia bacterium]